VNFEDVEMIIGARHVIAPAFAPVTATETKMTYTYEEGTVIGIDEYGVIYAIAAGTIAVTGTAPNGISSTFTVTVTDPDFTEKGDVDRNGEINALDLIDVKKHILDIPPLTGLPLLAADMNDDGKIDVVDLVLLKKKILMQ